MLTAEFAAVGATALLEAIRLVDPTARFYQASSSEIFGEPRETPQTEDDAARRPLTPYGVAKAYAHFITRELPRAATGCFACSRDPLQPRVAAAPRSSSCRARSRTGRGRDRARARATSSSSVTSTARRDWGYAGDYVRAMWLMLQQDEPGDYVVATGESHTVEELVELRVQRTSGSTGASTSERTTLCVRGKAELHDLVGDASKAHRAARLGTARSDSRSSSESSWTPTSPRLAEDHAASS